jgi:phospholipid-binding lipoprotein MlaA
MRLRLSTAILAPALLLAGLGAAAASEPRDPFEPWNRRVHAFNRTLQDHVLAPAAQLYTETVPRDVRRGVANAVSNLGEPVSAAAGLAAGEFGLAWQAAARFGINSTLGWGGVRDRAAEMGWPRRSFGLADTLCSWGVPGGPFVVLPVLGPSNLRDAGGRLATGVLLGHLIGPDVTVGLAAGDAFLAYAEVHGDLLRIQAQALDPYAMLRSAYGQRRAQACPVDLAAAGPEDHAEAE